MALDEVLETLFERLGAAHPTILDLLVHPGLPAEEVRDRLVSFSGYAPTELVTWYTWQNGIRERDWTYPGRMSIVAHWRPLSLDEAIDDSRAYRDLSPRSQRMTPASWLQVFDKEYHRLFADTGAYPHAVPIIVRSTHGDPDARRADSLEELLSLWLELFDYGMRWRDRTQMLLPDDRVDMPERLRRAILG